MLTVYVNKDQRSASMIPGELYAAAIVASFPEVFGSANGKVKFDYRSFEEEESLTLLSGKSTLGINLPCTADNNIIHEIGTNSKGEFIRSTPLHQVVNKLSEKNEQLSKRLYGSLVMPFGVHTETRGTETQGPLQTTHVFQVNAMLRRRGFEATVEALKESILDITTAMKTEVNVEEVKKYLTTLGNNQVLWFDDLNEMHKVTDHKSVDLAKALGTVYAMGLLADGVSVKLSYICKHKNLPSFPTIKGISRTAGDDYATFERKDFAIAYLTQISRKQPVPVLSLLASEVAISKK